MTCAAESDMPDAIAATARARVEESFARQGMTRTIGAEVVEVSDGAVTVSMPVSAAVGQQHGYVHAGAVTTLLDTACGYAALTLARPGHEVLSIGFTVNLVEPATGVRLDAEAEVVRPGRTSVCTGRAWAVGADGARRMVALMQATMALRPPAP